MTADPLGGRVRTSRRLVLGVVVVTLLTWSSAIVTPAAAAEAVVTITSAGSAPDRVELRPGDRVTIVNRDTVRHRLRVREPEDVDSDTIEPGESATVTLPVAGTYHFLDERTDDPADGLTAVVTATTPAAGATRGQGAGVQHPADGGQGAPAPSKAGGDAAPSASAAAEVTIPDRVFSPTEVTVRVGGTVTWRNQDGSHTVTARDDGFDSGIFDDGQTFAHTFTQPGTFGYLCRLHPEMTGTVTVVGAGTPADPPSTPDPSPTPTPGPPSPTPTPDASSEPASASDTDAVDPERDGPLVRAADLQFDPDPVHVEAGTAVTWEVADDLPHTVTGDAFDSGVLEPGDTYTATFDEVGTFRYRCLVHPGMEGQVVVAAAGEATSTDADDGTAGSAAGPTAVRAAPAGEPSSGLPFAATVLFAGMVAAFVTGRVTSRP